MHRQACILISPLVVIIQCCLLGLSLKLPWHDTDRLSIIMVLNYNTVNSMYHFGKLSLHMTMTDFGVVAITMTCP